MAVRSGVGNKYDGKLTVFPGAEEGSIEFEACLSSETLQALAEDAEFTRNSLAPLCVLSSMVLHAHLYIINKCMQLTTCTSLSIPIAHRTIICCRQRVPKVEHVGSNSQKENNLLFSIPCLLTSDARIQRE